MHDVLDPHCGQSPHRRRPANATCVRPSLWQAGRQGPSLDRPRSQPATACSGRRRRHHRAGLGKTPSESPQRPRCAQERIINLVISEGYMVGAAGFEPTTCSTQNCRATRLRYTPNIPGNDVDTRLSRGQQGGSRPVSPAIKERMPDAVSRLDAVFLRGASDHLQHPLYESPRRDDPG
jgi:hypothetical protein